MLTIRNSRQLSGILAWRKIPNPNPPPKKQIQILGKSDPDSIKGCKVVRGSRVYESSQNKSRFTKIRIFIKRDLFGFFSVLVEAINFARRANSRRAAPRKILPFLNAWCNFYSEKLFEIIVSPSSGCPDQVLRCDIENIFKKMRVVQFSISDIGSNKPESLCRIVSTTSMNQCYTYAGLNPIPTNLQSVPTA